jgi:nucleoside-diphosphate-sugar epimerase
MRVVVTGGASALARDLIAAVPPGTTIRAVDLRFTTDPPPGVEHRAGDLRDSDFAASVVADADDVVHLAPLTVRFPDDLETLDHAARGTYHLARAAREAGVRQFILGSTLALFDACDPNWQVTERWRPQPQPTPALLATFLAERSLREVARETGLVATCLRLGNLAQGGAALAAALTEPAQGWSVRHIEDGWRPAGVARPVPTPARPIHKIVIFGAGGPLAAAAATELAPVYHLRLTDARPIETAAAGPPQSPGAPLPVQPAPPHEWRIVDVTDAHAVSAACAGMDAIINCTVVRPDPVAAWRVNLLGVQAVMRAAVAQGIKRVVHTGPFQVAQPGPAGYAWDDFVAADASPRPGTHLYIHTKYLGQELCRVYAEWYGLEVPALLFCNFVNPDQPAGRSLHPLTVSWRDAGVALRRAVEVATLPTPMEVFHIGADLPHGAYPNDKAKQLLGWQPRDTLAALYTRSQKEEA